MGGKHKYNNWWNRLKDTTSCMAYLKGLTRGWSEGPLFVPRSLPIRLGLPSFPLLPGPILTRGSGGEGISLLSGTWWWPRPRMCACGISRLPAWMGVTSLGPGVLVDLAWQVAIILPRPLGLGGTSSIPSTSFLLATTGNWRLIWHSQTFDLEALSCLDKTCQISLQDIHFTQVHVVEKCL